VKSRILVVLEPHQEGERLLRSSMRRAQRENIDCEVLLMETPHFYWRLSPKEREILANLASQAEQMGAITTHSQASSMVRGVIDILEQRMAQGITITALKVGEQPTKNNWTQLLDLRPSLYEQLKKPLEKKCLFWVCHWDLIIRGNTTFFTLFTLKEMTYC
jgi:K+-sensing histidine kinase KdpD